MPFDAIFLSAVVQELRQRLINSRVEKITQPARDTLVVQLRTQTGHEKLLLAANQNFPRLHLTSLSYENPATPPMFCMLLRKHLSGGRLVELVQPEMERAVRLRFACTDALGSACEKSLAAELIGGAANILLLDQDDRIMDCTRRTDFDRSDRPALPGLFYRPPARPGRRSPLACSVQALEEMLFALPGPKRFDKWLLESFSGLSPLIARELSFVLSGQTDTDLYACTDREKHRLAEELYQQFHTLDKHTPILLVKDGTPTDFSFRPILQYGNYLQQQPCESFSGLLDDFYGQRDQREKLRQRSAVMHKTIANLRDRTQRKLGMQRQELEKAKDRDRLRQLGDIITANLYRMTRGQAFLEADDFYAPDGGRVRIALNVTLTPQRNAAKYYKDYAKAKNAERMLGEQITAAEQELAYLESVLDELERAENEKDLNDIRSELLAGGYLREKSKQMRQPDTGPLRFCSSDGFTILVGRNNRQNDALTFKLASKRDIWLHAQKIPGSHVVIVCDGRTPPEQTLTEAMLLAAYYSKARSGSLVPVDACPVKLVKKPPGAKPGMVTYTQQTTGFVTPGPEIVESLKINPNLSKNR